jgi:PadR family transcriptional regulator, regulatory protein PadR
MYTPGSILRVSYAIIMYKLTHYEETLLRGWEDIHKMGQLSLWLMLALKDGAKHMSQIKDFVELLTAGTLSADDKSIYRALRRYHDSELVGFKKVPSSNGPDLKVYHLTETGKHVLGAFLSRNIHLFYRPQIRKLIEKG